MSQQIEHTGIINHIENNLIKVLIVQQSACSGCHAKGACTAADQDEKIIDIESSDPSFKVGEFVTIYGQSSMGLFAVLLAFVFPFILILLVLIYVRSLVASESVAGLIALSSLIPYYIILSLNNKKLKSKFRFSIKKQSEV